MNEFMDALSAIALALLTVFAAGAIARFLVWRDGLRPRDDQGQGRERF